MKRIDLLFEYLELRRTLMQDIFNNINNPEEYEMSLALYKKNEAGIKAVTEYLRSLEKESLPTNLETIRFLTDIYHEVNAEYANTARKFPDKEIPFHEYYLTTRMFAFNETLDKHIKLDDCIDNVLFFFMTNKSVPFKDLSEDDKRYLALKVKEFNK